MMRQGEGGPPRCAVLGLVDPVGCGPHGWSAYLCVTPPSCCCSSAGPPQVLAQAGHVCLYRMQVDTQQWVSLRQRRTPTSGGGVGCGGGGRTGPAVPPSPWNPLNQALAGRCGHARPPAAPLPPPRPQVRKNVEGSLFLTKRRADPRFQLLVLNKIMTGKSGTAPSPHRCTFPSSDRASGWANGPPGVGPGAGLASMRWMRLGRGWIGRRLRPVLSFVGHGFI